MESQLPAPRPSQETGAYNPQTLPPNPEALAVTAGAERPAQQEVAPAQSTQPSLPVPLQPAPSTASPPILQPLVVPDENPQIAGDDEVIEKEWVDKAKKIVSETKNDPYEQEKQVSRLQADYLKKRYGKEVKVSSE